MTKYQLIEVSQGWPRKRIVYCDVVGDLKTDKTHEDICNYLRAGMSKKDAAVMAGISEKTFYRWVAEDDSFDSLVEASILQFKHSLIQGLNKAAETSPRIALEILRTRWPKEWNPKWITSEEKDESRASMDRLADTIQAMFAMEEPEATITS